MPNPLTKVIKVPKGPQFREATIEVRGEGDDESFTMSISSDTPYKRHDWWNDEDYYEVLDHGPGGMDDARLKAGLPILFNHDRNQHLGKAEDFETDGHRCTVGGIKWSGSEFAQQKRRDAASGALPHTSVGYHLSDEGECVGAKDGIPIYKFKWTPYEASLVTVPADISVGVGRQRSDEEFVEIRVRMQNAFDGNPKREEKPGKQNAESAKNMETTAEEKPTIDVVQERQDAVNRHKAGVKKIREWVVAATKKNPDWREAVDAVAEKHIDGNADFTEFMTEVWPAIPGARTVDTPHEEQNIGLSKKDRKRFSFRKALLEVWQTGRLTGHEKAVCDAAIEQYAGKDSRVFTGIVIPDDITHSEFAYDRDLSSNEMRALVDQVSRLATLQERTLNVSTFTAGGALVGTDLLGGSMIDILRNAVLIGQGPLAITELGGLIGNIAIPKQTGTGSVFWLAEAAQGNAADVTFAQLFLSPHRMFMQSSYSKQLLAQASVGVEAFVRQDQMLTMAVEEDRVVIIGQGLNGEPLGILNTTGVLANVTFGGNATWSKITQLEYALENANVRTGQMALLTSPLTKNALKNTLKVSASTFPIYLWEDNKGFPTINGVLPGTVNDYAAYATRNVTNNVVIQGVFQNVFKGRWAGLDVVVDPFTGAASETIKVTMNQWMDVGLRYPQSFNASTDAPTSP